MVSSLQNRWACPCRIPTSGGGLLGPRPARAWWLWSGPGANRVASSLKPLGERAGCRGIHRCATRRADTHAVPATRRCVHAGGPAHEPQYMLEYDRACPSSAQINALLSKTRGKGTACKGTRERRPMLARRVGREGCGRRDVRPCVHLSGGGDLSHGPMYPGGQKWSRVPSLLEGSNRAAVRIRTTVEPYMTVPTVVAGQVKPIRTTVEP